MRMWMVPPQCLCRKHLLGEHVELHMLVGTLRRGKSIAGFLAGGLVAPMDIFQRHEALVQEMLRRGYRHQSPMSKTVFEEALEHVSPESLKGHVNWKENLAVLRQRCGDCKHRIDSAEFLERCPDC